MDLKPRHQGGYSPVHSRNCERVLVALMRGMGPYRDSLVLVGGLAPRYIVGASDPSDPPPPHVGTTDVDLLVDITMLANVQAYRTLKHNLGAMGFERDRNDDDMPVHYRWKREMDDGTSVLIDFLQDSNAVTGEVTQLLPQKGVSALSIEGARMAQTYRHPVDVAAESIHGGMTVETINVIDVAPFIAMKALAFEDRGEPKDAYDLIYLLLHYHAGMEQIAAEFELLLANDDVRTHAEKALAILRKRFTSDELAQGHEKEGCYAYAVFLTDTARREKDVMNARTAAAAVSRFLALVTSTSPAAPLSESTL